MPLAANRWQTMQQPKNLLLFIVLTVLILVGWHQLSVRLWPPRSRPTPPPEEKSPWVWENLRPREQSEVFARLAAAAAPAGAGVDTIGSTATAAAVADWSVHQENRVVKREPEPRPEIKKGAPPAPHYAIQMGDDQSSLKVALTTLGGGVESVILNHFPQATSEGKPDGNPPVPLHLVRTQSFDPTPSNLLYLYANEKDDRPVDTLGKEEWELVSPKNPDPHTAYPEVVFAYHKHPEVDIIKTYRLNPKAYDIELTLEFRYKGAGGKSAPLRYQLASGHGLPIEGDWYNSVFRNALIGEVDNRGEVYRDVQDARSIGIKDGGDVVKKHEDRFLQYAGVATQYFTSLVVVDDHQEAGVRKEDLVDWARPTLATPDSTNANPAFDDITARMVSVPIELTPGKPVVHKYVLYNGPVKVRLLGNLEGAAAVPPKLVSWYVYDLHLNSLTDYPRFWGWSHLIIFCTNVMHSLLWYLHKVLWNYGVCIIVLTLLVRGMMFPLSRKQAIASAKMQAKMQELAPEVKKLEEKFKDDPQGLQRAKTELYLKRGVHPLAMMGSCWVIFLQMPIFLGLYYALQESIDFRLAPFLWIQNLAAPDMLWRWGTNVWPISGILGPYLNVLPIIAVAFMIVQQKMMTPPPTDEQQAMQQKMMKYMTIFIGYMFYKVAAGLCLYFITSSAWGVMERKLLPKNKTSVAAAPGKPGAPAPGPAGRLKARAPRGNGQGKLQKVRDFWDKVLKEAKKK